MSTQTVTTIRTIRIAPIVGGIIALAVIITLALALIPSSHPTTSDHPHAIIASGAPMAHLTGSVYEP
jgi:hypothetical protein